MSYHIMVKRGGKLSNSRLKSQTYTIRYCRFCGSAVDMSTLNLHFVRAHPEIYYIAYPGRRKPKMAEDAI